MYDLSLQAVTGRITLTALLEMLADAAAMGAGKSDIMDKLQLRAANAKAFEAKAAPCLAAIEAAAAAAASTAADTEAAAPDEAADSAVAGATSEAVGSVASTDTAAATDPASTAVDMRDAEAAAVQVEPAKVSLAELESLVQEGQAIGIKLDSLTDLSRLLNAAQAWSAQAEYCLTGKEPHITKHKRHIQRPSLEKVNGLVDELQHLPVVLPQAEDLCNRQQQALDWVNKATAVLHQGNLGQNLPDVQAIVGQGAAFGLEMPELTQLDALVRATEWNSRVKQALRLPAASPHTKPAQLQPATVTQQSEAMPIDSMQQGPTGSPQRDRGNPAPAGPPSEPTVSSFAASPTVIPMAERLTLAEAEDLVEQGQELPVEPAVLQRLTELAESGQQWERQASMHAKLGRLQHTTVAALDTLVTLQK